MGARLRSRELDLTSYDTDKVRNGYLERYDPVFEPWLDRDLALLELGVHTGGSLELWRDYFPQAAVTGIDVSLPEAFEPGDRIRVFEGSQASPEFLAEVAAEVAPGGFDIIIDDASHFGELTRISFWHLFDHHLKPGGLYVIEDWGTGYFDDWPDGCRMDPALLSGGGSKSPSFLRRVGRRLGIKQRFRSHDYGTVGLIKQLVDEQGARDATCQTLHGSASRPSRFQQMMIVPSIAFIWKMR
jgi:hypothetical protein